MKQALIFFVWIAWSAQSWAAQSLGGHASGFTSGLSSSVTTGTFSVQPTAGSTIVVGVRNVLNASETLSSVTDAAGNTYTAVSGANCLYAPAGLRVQFWRAKNISTTATFTVTATFSGTTFDLSVSAAEIKEANTTEPNDVAACQSQVSPATTTDAITSGNTAATAGNGEFVFAMTSRGSGRGGHTAGTNYTELHRMDISGAEEATTSEYQIQSASGAIAGTFTTDFTDSYVTVVATFKGTSGGGGGSTFMYKRRIQ